MDSPPAPASATVSAAAPPPGLLERLGLGLAAWSEKWFPDAFVFALLGIVLVFCFGLCLGERPEKLAVEGGKAFWGLVPFTMQMAMVVIGGYVVASAPAVHALIRLLAGLPRTPRGAIAWIAFFSMTSSLLSWGFSLVMSGFLVREIARRMRGLDYRAAGAAAYLGLGAVWALGLSSSAALMMSTKTLIPAKLFDITGLIPLTATLFTGPNLLMALALVFVSVAVAWLSAPTPERAKTAADFGIAFPPEEPDIAPPTRPGEWLEYSPVLTLLACALLGWYLYDLFRTCPQGPLAAFDTNAYNLIVLVLGLLLHWRPKRFLRAVNQSVPATAGVLIQFPFYAVIFGMISETGIARWLADLFVAITTRDSYPLLVALYSAVLGVFIPSGGSKWIIEAPYVLQAAIEHRVNLGWVVQIYNAAEALPNLLNPFWMLPLLGILRVRARDLVGFAALQLAVHLPIVFLLSWYFARTLPFVPPIK